MGALALGIAVAVAVVGGLLTLLVRRHVAHADRRDFATGDDGGPVLVPGPGPGSHPASDFCGGADGGGGDCGGGDGGGGGGD